MAKKTSDFLTVGDQDLNTTDTPSFVGVSANTITPSSGNSMLIKPNSTGVLNIGLDGAGLESINIGTSSTISLVTIGVAANKVFMPGGLDVAGDIINGTWKGDLVQEIYGGTGHATYATGDLLYAANSSDLNRLAAGTDTHVLTLAAGVPTWAAGATLPQGLGTTDTPTFAGFADLSKSTSSAASIMIIGGNATITGNYNIALGIFSARDLTSGTDNVFIGRNTGSNVTTGGFNICLGQGAGSGFVAGVSSYTNSITIGQEAGFKLISGNRTILLGQSAGYSRETAGDSIGIGYKAIENNVNGTNVVCIGQSAGAGTVGESHNNSICIGQSAGAVLGTGGDNNMLIGTLAGNSITSGSKNVCIGYNSDTSSPTATNQCIIGGTAGDAVNTGLGGQNNPQEAVDVTGNILVSGTVTIGGTDCVLDPTVTATATAYTFDTLNTITSGKIASFLNNTSEIMNVDAGGVNITGTLDISGSITSGASMTIDPSQVGANTSYSFDTNGLITSGKMVSVLNNGAEKLYIGNDRLNLVIGVDYRINDVSVLNATTLGVGVVASSLTSVGTIATGVWQGTAIASTYIGDLSSTYQPLDGDLTAIAALAGTTGFLEKTAADTWTLNVAGATAGPFTTITSITVVNGIVTALTGS